MGASACPQQHDNYRAFALYLSIFLSIISWAVPRFEAIKRPGSSRPWFLIGFGTLPPAPLSRGFFRPLHFDPLVEVPQAGCEPAGAAITFDVQAPLALGEVDCSVLLDREIVFGVEQQ